MSAVASGPERTGSPTSPAHAAAAADRARRDFVLVASISLLVAATYAFLVATDVLGAATKALVSDVVLVPLALWLVLSARVAVRRGAPRSRRKWRLLWCAGLSWTVAEAAWSWDRQVAEGDGGLSLADPFYLLAVVPAVAMLLSLIPREVGPERPRQLVGALVVAGAVFYLIASAAPDSVILSRDVPLATALVLLAYPICDIVMASLALIALSGRGSARLPLVLLAAGFLSFAAADTAYAALGPSGGYVSGSAVDLGWAYGFLFMAAAAWAPGARHLFEQPRMAEFERAGSARSLLVYVPLLAAMVIIAGFAPRDGGRLLPVTEVVVFLLFGLRQALLARESAALRAALETQVAELQRTSSSLAHLAQTNERMIESVSDGIFGVDATGRLTFANAAALEMLGRDATSLIGARPERTFVARLEGSRGEPTENPITTALGTGMPSGTLSAYFARGDGGEFPIEWGAGPITDDDGHTRGAVVVFRDITRRRHVERIKDEFVSVVSHELRTPLTTVRGALGLLASGVVGPLTERAASLSRRGLDSAERLARLVDDLLDVERIESGAKTMEFTECSAAELIRTSVDGVSTIAADVPVRIRISQADATVHADPDRVIQALTNLLSNAIKFSPPHTLITVSATARGSRVEFTVADEGRGIPADKLERIFERFEQVDSSDSRLQGGTGLGLAITRSIVRRHRGEIWAESVPGHGSVFHFTLPAAIAGVESLELDGDDTELGGRPRTLAGAGDRSRGGSAPDDVLSGR